jgi:hypothetical protein
MEGEVRFGLLPLRTVSQNVTAVPSEETYLMYVLNAKIFCCSQNIWHSVILCIDLSNVHVHVFNIFIKSKNSIHPGL